MDRIVSKIDTMRMRLLRGPRPPSVNVNDTACHRGPRHRTPADSPLRRRAAANGSPAEHRARPVPFRRPFVPMMWFTTGRLSTTSSSDIVRSQFAAAKEQLQDKPQRPYLLRMSLRIRVNQVIVCFFTIMIGSATIGCVTPREEPIGRHLDSVSTCIAGPATDCRTTAADSR